MQLIERGTVTHDNLMMLHDNVWADPTKPTKMPEEIYVFFSWVEKDGKGWEESWVRFVKEGNNYTFSLNKTLTNGLVKGRIKLDSNAILDRLRTIARPKIELPKEWLAPAESHPEDNVLQEEYRAVDLAIEEMRMKVSKTLSDIKTTSHRLLALTPCRDHDLFMTFTMDPEDRTRFRLRYDKVLPKLPEEDLVIGVEPGIGLEYGDNKTYNAVIDGLKTREALINKQIENGRRKHRLQGHVLQHYNREVVATLLAGINFSGRVFSYDGEHGLALLEEMTNDILDKLYRARANSTRNIGLDISSWYVWEYPEDNSEPFRVTDPELQFVETIVEGYLDSFVSLLGQKLIESNHMEVIKPYQHRVVVEDLSDGFGIGSIRRTK